MPVYSSPNLIRATRRYLTLDRERLQAIWRNSGLISRKWRSAIFDADDFAYSSLHAASLSVVPNVALTLSLLAYKAEVAKWGDEQFRADVRTRLNITLAR